MQRKSVLFGFGIGLVLISTVFYFALVLTNETPDLPEPVAYTDDEIIEQAKKLGMVSMKELPQATEAPKELSEIEIVGMAEALGYELIKHEEDTSDEDPEVLNSEDIPEIPLSYDGSGTLVVIPSGSHSSDVARILEDTGVIDDANAFVSHVVSRGSSKRLKAGTFVFEPDLTYDQILNILTGR